MGHRSFYFSLSRLLIDSGIKPQNRKKHLQLLYGRCDDRIIIADNKTFVTHQCCSKHTSEDCLLLELFKKEWQGNELLVLRFV